MPGAAETVMSGAVCEHPGHRARSGVPVSRRADRCGLRSVDGYDKSGVIHPSLLTRANASYKNKPVTLKLFLNMNWMISKL